MGLDSRTISVELGDGAADDMAEELESTPRRTEAHAARCCRCATRLQLAHWAGLLCTPELLLGIAIAVMAIIAAAAVPHSHLLFGALSGMSTPFGVIFGIGAPLLLLHALRLTCVLVWWAARALGRALRRKLNQRDGEGIASSARDTLSSPHASHYSEGASSPSGKSAKAATPQPRRGWRRATEWGRRASAAHRRSCASQLAVCDFCTGLILYLVLGLTASLAWSHCAPPPPLLGAPADTAVDPPSELAEAPPNNTMLARELRFPPSFKFGAATAAYQVEGGLYNSSWHAFERSLPPYEHTQDRQTTREYAGRAADMWELFDEELERMESLHLQTYRMSVSWSRLHPARGQFDMSALERYRRWLQSLRSAGIEPMVTLLHYEEPLWVSMQGSWANASTADHWIDFVSFVAAELGGEVDVWVTQNEPFVFAGVGWLEGRWPPGLRMAIRDWWLVMVHLSSAHRRAYAALHALDTVDADGDGRAAMVGIAKNLNVATPARMWSVVDPLVAGVGVWGLVNMLYLELIGGRSSLDYLGINHYFELTVRGGEHSFGVPETSLYQITCEAADWFPGLPIAVTEHGYWTTDFPGVEDEGRQRYILGSLRHLMRATQQGIVVLAYQYWALLDSYEWESGFRPRFGLYAVNFTADDRPRSKRDFATIYGSVAARHEQQMEDATRRARAVTSCQAESGGRVVCQ
jgi:beta-glucosidase